LLLFNSSKTDSGMKAVFIALLVSLTPFVLSANPGSETIPPDLSTALGKGDVTTISSYFADKVEVKIDGESETLMKTDATSRVREFYTGNPATGFKAMSSDKTSEKPAMEVGELTTDKGTYRVYVEFSKEATKPQITALRFEK
jgi:hypothetical protein